MLSPNWNTILPYLVGIALVCSESPSANSQDGGSPDTTFDLCLSQDFGRFDRPYFIKIVRSADKRELVLTVPGTLETAERFEYSFVPGLPETLPDGAKIFVYHEPPNLKSPQLFFLEYPDGRVEVRSERLESFYSNRGCNR